MQVSLQRGVGVGVRVVEHPRVRRRVVVLVRVDVRGEVHVLLALVAGLREIIDERNRWVDAIMENQIR